MSQPDTLLPHKRPFPVFSKEQIIRILTDEYLFERDSFFYVDEERRQYQTNLNTKDVLIDHARLLYQKYKEGCTLVVKNLEDRDSYFRSLCRSLPGKNKDIHMYLSPPNGSAFDYHTDDKNVKVIHLYGKKMFYVNDELIFLNGSSKDKVVDIPKGVKHKARTIGASGILSYGYDLDTDQ